jgi:hypothetical protein
VKIDEDLGVVLFANDRIDDVARDGACFVEEARFDVHDEHVMRRELFGDAPARPRIRIVP